MEIFFFHMQQTRNEIRYIDHNVYMVYHLQKISLASSYDSFAQ